MDGAVGSRRVPTWLRRVARSAGATRRGAVRSVPEARLRLVLQWRLRQMSRGARNTCDRAARSRPYACRQPRVARRRDACEPCRDDGRMDCRRSGREARESHAIHGHLQRSRVAGRVRVAREPGMTLPNPLPRPADELARLQEIWRLPSGWRRLTAVNNTVVGLWYIGAALLFLVLGG